MKIFLPTLLVNFVLLALAGGAPVGLCFHAYGPDAPPDKVQCFEYEKCERVANDYRFFLSVDKTAMVTGYRFRNIIPYKTDLTPGDPEFDRLLKLYEETSASIPSSRRYLNSRILAMRDQVAKLAAEKLVKESLPKITLEKDEYWSPRYKAVEGGKLVIDHKDGVAKIDLDKITDGQLQALVQLDSNAAALKVVEICGNRLWNASMAAIFANTVKIRHAKGLLTLKFDALGERDRKIIDGWSDGTWKIAKAGFYGAQEGGKSYAEFIMENGRIYKNARLDCLVGESVSVMTDEGNIRIPFDSLGELPGIAKPDQARAETWAAEILENRLRRATPVTVTEVIKSTAADVVRVTNIRALILQVLDEGVLASEFVGKLQTGTQTERTTQVVKARHPVTNEEISRVISSATEEVEVVEIVNDDLCYIVGDTSKLVDGEIVRIDSMKPMGRHRYVDVLGRVRTVREYHVNSADVRKNPMIDQAKIFPAGMPDDINRTRRAAESGDADAQYNLAQAYSDGRGVAKDMTEAVKWYRRASKQGHTTSQLLLGGHYIGGAAHDEGGDDDVMAYMWFSVAAIANVEDGRRFRDSLRPTLSRNQLAKAEELVRTWKPAKEVGGE